MKILGVVLLLLGVFFAFFPHSVHESLGLTAAHVFHVSGGVVLLAVGAFVGWKSMKKKTPSA